uniref:Uncharacterized protein n=1 Tax=Candidatus Kentrum sp. LPFa TaxID=2126335 RepID=A0A450VUU6_9GAMM|nr:MAG: hypothetical protein BECKLPF1236A_GA0070988_1001813 [Candidatus Kentron sp. LPFa]
MKPWIVTYLWRFDSPFLGHILFGHMSALRAKSERERILARRITRIFAFRYLEIDAFAKIRGINELSL